MPEQTLRLLVLPAALALAAACGRVDIPYDLVGVRAHEAPVHAVRIAIVPFEDGREAEDAGSAERYVYQGVDFIPTDLGKVRGGFRRAITGIVGHHLARSRVFAQVILVDGEGDAPEADLILTGRIKRARGYVEAEERKPKSAKKVDERTVLAEVLLEDLELREAGGARRVLLRTDVGWSILEDRKAVPEPPVPWDVLGEALQTALDQLTAILADADLSGAYVVQDRVALSLAPIEAAATSSAGAEFGDLSRGPPDGWRFEHGPEARAPIGWKGKQGCKEARLSERQMMHFHRVLGPYRPTVILWACPPWLRVEYDALAEIPAQYLGRRFDGLNYFGHAIGQSNWPDALEQIAKHLRITPPPARYVFEVGG